MSLSSYKQEKLTTINVWILALMENMHLKTELYVNVEPVIAIVQLVLIKQRIPVKLVMYFHSTLTTMRVNVLRNALKGG